jgi:hypothetical protein
VFFGKGTPLNLLLLSTFAADKACHSNKLIKLKIMYKKIFIAIALLFGVGVTSFWAAQIPMSIIDKSGSDGGHTYAPPRPWYITQDEIVFTLSATPEDYTLVLLDEDDEVVYSDTLLSGSTMFVLPSTLSGNFELRLIPFASTYCYRGYLEL